MVVTYYIKLVRAGSDRHNVILMSLLLLVTETIRILSPHLVLFCLDINLLVKYVLFFREICLSVSMIYPIVEMMQLGHVQNFNFNFVFKIENKLNLSLKVI